jgi:two-component system NarL family sensor kinase
MQLSESELSFFIILLTSMVFMFGMLIILVISLLLRNHISFRKDLKKVVQESEANLLHTEITARESALHHVSREIHDHINLSLILAKLNLNTLELVNKEKTKSSLEFTVELITGTIEDLRNLSKTLNTEVINNLGLLRALQMEIERFESVTNIVVDYQVTGNPIFLESAKELTVYRMIQESLNNILKHAHATSVLLHLNYDKFCFDITIQDNGVGFDPEYFIEDGKHTGIMNLNTRARLFKGSVLIQSFPGKGTQIFITVPYNSL